jgi:hypothetical protein
MEGFEENIIINGEMKIFSHPHLAPRSITIEQIKAELTRLGVPFKKKSKRLELYLVLKGVASSPERENKVEAKGLESEIQQIIERKSPKEKDEDKRIKELRSVENICKTWESRLRLVRSLLPLEGRKREDELNKVPLDISDIKKLNKLIKGRKKKKKKEDDDEDDED